MVAGHLQEKNGKWYAVITYKDKGKAKSKWYSTGLTVKGNKRKAESLLQEKRKEFDARLCGEDNTCNITLRELYPEWIKYKAVISSAATNVIRIESSWKKFYESESQDIIDMPLRLFTKLDLQEWSYKLVKKYNMTAKQYGNFSLIIRQMLDFAVDKGFISQNIYKEVSRPTKLLRKERKKPSKTQVYSEEEQRLLEEAAWQDFMTNTRRVKYPLAPLGIIFMLQTGVRAGELCALRYDDILDGKEIHVQRMHQSKTKQIVDHTKSDNGDRLIPLTSKAQKVIKMAQEAQREKGISKYIFSINNEKPMEEYAINDTLKTLCNKLGILYRSSHKLRKTVVSKLIDGGVNIDTVREIAGHADEKTTLTYYCYDRNVDEERRKKIIEAIG